MKQQLLTEEAFRLLGEAKSTYSFLRDFQQATKSPAPITDNPEVY